MIILNKRTGNPILTEKIFPVGFIKKSPLIFKDARFNLYLIEHDASKGVHNAPYARYLLSVAQDKVNAELRK